MTKLTNETGRFFVLAVACLPARTLSIHLFGPGLFGPGLLSMDIIRDRQCRGLAALMQ
jgi:hypothetical protein